MPAIRLRGSCPAGQAREASHTPLSRAQAGTQHWRSPFPPGWAGTAANVGTSWASASCHTSQRERPAQQQVEGRLSFPRCFQERTSIPPSRKAAKPLGSKQKHCPPAIPEWHGHGARAFLPTTSRCPRTAQQPHSPPHGSLTLGTAARQGSLPLPPPHTGTSPTVRTPSPRGFTCREPFSSTKAALSSLWEFAAEARQGQRDFTGTSQPAGRPPSPGVPASCHSSTRPQGRSSKQTPSAGFWERGQSIPGTGHALAASRLLLHPGSSWAPWGERGQPHRPSPRSHTQASSVTGQLPSSLLRLRNGCHLGGGCKMSPSPQGSAGTSASC
ncbi:uncharacterized protein LOC129736986 [Falco cherrug]|uniref:uncharacterized protein LOC129736986 n=1 Tax=Falco cherrug TaxID=345164 RepID=UPI002478A31E|nr:uncharacterized protein LOC129736986 [Falco cherrug]